MKKVYETDYATYDKECLKFAHKVSSDKNREEYLGFMGLGLLPVKGEGAATQMQDMEQGFAHALNNVSYSLGYQITREARDDGQYMQIAMAQTKALAKSERITQETHGANILNRAFSSSYTGRDGVELGSSAHLTKAGATYANELATTADLSEASLEQACTDISLLTDERGLRAQIKPQGLIVHPANRFEASRLLKSTHRVDTANNDISVINSENILPDGYSVNHYVTDTDAWFICNDINKKGEGIILQERQKAEFVNDSDFLTDNAQFKVFSRYVFGWLNPRAMFCVEGA